MRLCWSSPLQRAPPPTPHRPSQAKTPEARQPTEPFPLQACKMTSEAANLTNSLLATHQVLLHVVRACLFCPPPKSPPHYSSPSLQCGVPCSDCLISSASCYALPSLQAEKSTKCAGVLFFLFLFLVRHSHRLAPAACLPAASEELFALSRCVCSVCGGYDTRSAVEQRCILLLQRREWAVW